MYLLLCCKRHMSLTYLIRLTHLSLYNTFVCMTLFCLKVHFVWYWYSNSAVFWLLFAWYIFFYSFTVNLSLNLNLSQGWGCNSVVSSYLACMRPSVWSPVPQTNKQNKVCLMQKAFFIAHCQSLPLLFGSSGDRIHGKTVTPSLEPCPHPSLCLFIRLHNSCVFNVVTGKSRYTYHFAIYLLGLKHFSPLFPHYCLLVLNIF
jgi:hypothetical protein